MIHTPETLSVVGRKASAILGRPVSATAVNRADTPRTVGRMEQLLEFGKAHPDIVTISE